MGLKDISDNVGTSSGGLKIQSSKSMVSVLFVSKVNMSIHQNITDCNQLHCVIIQRCHVSHVLDKTHMISMD